MSKAPASKSRSTRRSRGGSAAPSAPPEATLGWHPTGARLRARLVAVERKVGVFAPQHGYESESRFRVAHIVPRDAELPAGMRAAFGEELASLERAGMGAQRCHRTELGPYTVYALAYFHYEGFQALVYVEHKDTFLAAWQDVEVEQTDSPGAILGPENSAPVEAFLEEVLGSAA